MLFSSKHVFLLPLTTVHAWSVMGSVRMVTRLAFFCFFAIAQVLSVSSQKHGASTPYVVFVLAAMTFILSHFTSHTGSSWCLMSLSWCLVSSSPGSLECFRLNSAFVCDLCSSIGLSADHKLVVFFPKYVLDSHDQYYNYKFSWTYL